ncbi:LysR family transcriptional regulator [Pseudaestuariivita sp.]|uniref:LysR family transcriptional regulator n=1 Tax=Pseudaestuariivita sp. TaxID=2211669 RepID=UPI004058C14E
MLNYHHLRYFREVARDGHLTRTAERLNVSQSALSTQIKTLEERLGHALFARKGRQLHLTEVGRIALDHADRIFEVGDELLATLSGTHGTEAPLRIGAVSTLSRNFQLQFLTPLLAKRDVDIILKSGNLHDLFSALRALALDVVLTTDIPEGATRDGLIAHKLAEQPVGLHGVPKLLRAGTLRDLLTNVPVIVPTESAIRTGFDALVARLGALPRIAASVDDMAMVRLLAREGVGLALAPEVVFADEIADGRIAAAGLDLGLVEPFYAVTVKRAFPHPRLEALIAHK